MYAGKIFMKGTFIAIIDPKLTAQLTSFIDKMNEGIEKAKLYAEYHVMKADEQYQSLTGFGDKYGSEFDASVMYPFSDAFWGKIEYAKFNESDVYGTSLRGAARKGDKEIIWVTAQYSF